MSDVKTVEMTLTNDGTFALDSLDRQLAFAQSLMSKGLISETYKNPSQVVMAIQMAKVMGVEPLIALKQSYVIQGKVAFFGDLPLAVCLKSGLVEFFDEFFLDAEMNKICASNKNLKSKVYAAVCQTRRKGDSALYESFYTLDEAAIAGLMKNQNYTKNPKDMILYRARTRCLKGKYADLLNGVETQEIIIGFDEKENEGDRAKKLTDLYSEPSGEVPTSEYVNTSSDLCRP